MTEVRTILLEKSVFSDNDRQADLLRARLSEKGTTLINVMSSPGAGKTTTLISVVNELKKTLRVGVMEADIDSDVDAVKVAERTGVKSVQLHTGGMCHLDASMTEQGLTEIGSDDLDLVFLENVGNLVCPAEYDTGAHLNMTILSVPEGDDKPLKYPLIYESCDLVVINKIDVSGYFSFDLEKCRKNIAYRNPSATVLPISAKTGQNVQAVVEYIRSFVQSNKEPRI